jgi:2-polyprenyl-6-methoxyphenol hydroxylase-like FAD-dependent oxidoreductase
MEQFDAIIVGGGVAGAAMGVALGRFAVKAVILERRTTVGEINRGDALQLAALRSLNRIGAVEPLMQAGAQITPTVVFSHYRKGVLGHFHIAELFDPPFNYLLSLPHEKIEQTLTEEAERRGVPTRRGHGVEGLRKEGEQMIVSVRTEQENYELGAKVVVAGDGKFSSVRKYVCEEPKTYWYRQECVAVEAENAAGVPAEMRMAYHPDGLLVIGRLAPTFVRVYIMALPNEANRIFKLPADEIGALAISRDPLLKDYRFIKRGGHVYKMGRYHCSRYVADGCALIGDAAHITGPAGGHGMNLAINDAEELADRIGPKLAAGQAITLEDLKGYEAERRQVNEETLRFAHDAFMRLTAPEWRYRLLRPLFFWLVSHVPVVRKWMAKPMLSLGTSPSKR